MSLVSATRALLIGVVPRVYRSEELPEGVARPYVTILDNVDQTVIYGGDGRAITWSVLYQVDLWEDEAVKDDALAEAVLVALNGVELGAPFTKAYVEQSRRLPDPDLVHTVYSVRTRRVR